MKRLSGDEVEREIGALDNLDTKALQQRWRTLYRKDPPQKIRARLLRLGIAYRLQELAFGGLQPKTVRLLRNLAAGLRTERAQKRVALFSDDTSGRAIASRPTLSPGSQLMREWNGSTEIVDVTRDGFRWRGNDYRTLSAVAVAITGTKWSGPKFFGLGPPRQPTSGGPLARRSRGSADANIGRGGWAGMSEQKTFRCAVYTRKSSEEGLEQDFNSLEAQREACEAYVRSQSHEGWKLIPDRFDDGGFSGGNMERPALRQLMELVDGGKIDIIVVYKIDRLTRSLTDFAKLADRLDKHGVSFVSVTQQFNTTTSMGRLNRPQTGGGVQLRVAPINQRDQNLLAAPG